MSSMQDEEEECSEVFVGGGWAGVYSLYRRIMDDSGNDDGTVKSSKEQSIGGTKTYCLFEQSWRIGGRTYSVNINQTEFILDIGSYRFSPDMHLPGDLIMKHLQLTTECYEATCPSAKEDFSDKFQFNYTAPLRRIVDPNTGLPGGYATAIWKMLEISQNYGAKVYTQTSLSEVSINEGEDGIDVISLKFYDSVNNMTLHVESPDLVMLNLPRNKLFEVKGIEDSLEKSVVDTLKCTTFDRPADLFRSASKLPNKPQTLALSKAYLYYEDAWWHTVLNKTFGIYPPNTEFGGTLTKEGMRFNIRWHDGPVSCSTKTNHSTSCHGLLESYYSLADETFYSSISPNANEPLGSVWNTDGPKAIETLAQVHAGMLDLLTPLLEEKGINPNALQPPSGLVVGIWRLPTKENPLGEGYTCPTKVYYEPSMSGSPANACGVPGLTEDSYRDTALQPWGNTVPMFLVNNDYVCLNVRYIYGDWAEDSLLQAERAMHLMGMKRPQWLNSSYYSEEVASKVTAFDGGSMTSTTSILFREGERTKRNGNTSNSSALQGKFFLGMVLLFLFLLFKAMQGAQRKKTYTVLP